MHLFNSVGTTGNLGAERPACSALNDSSPHLSSPTGIGRSCVKTSVCNDSAQQAAKPVSLGNGGYLGTIAEMRPIVASAKLIVASTGLVVVASTAAVNRREWLFAER
jgi:hypothetical protein